ncbi:glycoside hydrolase family 3 N-terminal domain-containing protein [Sagittula sp. SSi028]|uniref:glycoside hydrolase family 3 N-terminal domain-containing protein n=1 Tax=Sagittula sp. SSi028 TaxID=3400636 RepID=UPI003AF68DC1
MSRFGAAIFGCAGLRLSAEEKALFAQARPFGFILFARNLDTADQIRALCDEMRMAAGHDAPVFIDQEGGRVQRLRAPLAREFRPPLEDAALGARAFWLRARLIAYELRALGIDGNCIPTLDVARDQTHAILRNRCYGTDAATVALHGRAVADGLMAGGVLPVMKHMPGHGLGTLDSHKDLPRVNAAPDALEAVDFAPFKALNDLPLGMSAHLVFEAIDPRPATVSPVMVDVIRKLIGFDGLLMTDDISMEALSGSVAERGVAARAAGCDLVLHCNGDLAEMQSIWADCGTMDGAAQTRAEAALAARQAPDDIDIAALNAEFDRLIA